MQRCEQRPELIVFDVDGTLVRTNDGAVVWQVFNRVFGIDPDECTARAKRFFSGAITYAEWVDSDVGGWQQAGATRPEMVVALRENLAPTPGADALMEAAQRAGCKLAIISGTLNVVIETFYGHVSFDQVYCNQIDFDEQGAICDWTPTPYDLDGKGVALTQLVERLGISAEQTVFIGDHFNDVSAMSLAGFAVGYEPKDPRIVDVSDVQISGDMSQLIPILGL